MKYKVSNNLRFMQNTKWIDKHISFIKAITSPSLIKIHLNFSFRYGNIQLGLRFGLHTHSIVLYRDFFSWNCAPCVKGKKIIIVWFVGMAADCPSISFGQGKSCQDWDRNILCASEKITHLHTARTNGLCFIKFHFIAV